MLNFYETRFKLSGVYMISAKEKKEAKEKVLQLFEEEQIIPRLQEIIKAKILNEDDFILDVELYQEESEYELGSKEYDVHFQLIWAQIVKQKDKEAVRCFVTEFINDNIKEIENILNTAVADPCDEYVFEILDAEGQNKNIFVHIKHEFWHWQYDTKEELADLGDLVLKHLSNNCFNEDGFKLQNLLEVVGYIPGKFIANSKDIVAEYTSEEVAIEEIEDGVDLGTIVDKKESKQAPCSALRRCG
ncbi:MAG: hypothetical protein ACOCQR_03710, partial [bacterium]